MSQRGFRGKRRGEFLGIVVLFVGTAIWIYSESGIGPIAFAITAVMAIAIARLERFVTKARGGM